MVIYLLFFFVYFCNMGNVIVLLYDYFKLNGLKHFIRSMLIPLFLSATAFFILRYGGVSVLKKVLTFMGTSSNILGILLGFLIAVLALLVSSNNENINRTKKTPIEVTSLGKEKSLFDLLVADITWTTFCTAFGLLLSLIALLFDYKTIFSSYAIVLVLVMVLTYCICQTIEVALHLYLVLKAKQD